MHQIELCSKGACTGCMACKQKCKKNAISVKYTNGFVYPEIDDEICVRCGACMKACPILNGEIGNIHNENVYCYAAWNKSEEVRMNSSSGGAFTAFAEKILGEGGAVFGAAWDNDLNLSHRYIEQISLLDELRRSKYVQSDVRNTYNEVVELLKKGRKVLYCGTPCQIAGLTSFLGYKNYDNLIKIDVICQGVPSNKLFKKYIKEIESNEKIQILDVNFRSKLRGWRCGLLLLLLRVKKWKGIMDEKRILSKNEYYRSFIKGYFMRESCYDCQFKLNHKGYFSDLSIADFWQIGKRFPIDKEGYEKGISAIIVNTNQGEIFFDECKDKLHVLSRRWEEFCVNGGLRSSAKPADNDKAMEFLLNHTWKETYKKFFPYSIKEKMAILISLGLGQKNIIKIKSFWGLK